MRVTGEIVGRVSSWFACLSLARALSSSSILPTLRPPPDTTNLSREPLLIDGFAFETRCEPVRSVCRWKSVLVALASSPLASSGRLQLSSPSEKLILIAAENRPEWRT